MTITSLSQVLSVVLLAMTRVQAMSVAKPKILSVGLAAVDFVATCPHFPEPDEKMRSTSLLVEGGGNAANSACAMAQLLEETSSVGLVTAVGDDANGKTILAELEERGVQVQDTTEVYPGSSPFSYILSADVNGENTRTIVHQPSSGDLSLEFVKQMDLSDVTAAHFDARYPAAAVVLAKRCVEADIPYSVDVERPREGLDDLLADATVVICNANYCDLILKDDEEEEENDMTFQQRTVDRLVRVVSKQAPKAELAVMTLGSKGSCLVQLSETKATKDKGLKTILEDDSDSNVPKVTQQDGALWCAAWGGCNVVDTTGAGDAFQGGFLAALWSFVADQAETTLPTDPVVLGHALRIASRVAACKCEKPGARKGLPRTSEDAFLQAEMEALKAKELVG